VFLFPSSSSFPFSEPKRTFDIWGETLTADELRIITGATATVVSSGVGAGGHNYAKSEKDARAKQQQAQQQQQDDAMKDVSQPEEEPQKTIRESITVSDTDRKCAR
jgi:hypothetical protein